MRARSFLLRALVVAAGGLLVIGAPAAADEAEDGDLHSFWGRVIEVRDGGFEARSFLGVGPKFWFETSDATEVVRGERMPLSYLHRGHWVRVWYRHDEDGDRVAVKVRVGGGARQ